MNQTSSQETPKSTMFLNVGGVPQMYYLLSQEEFMKIQSQLRMYETSASVPKVFQKPVENKKSESTMVTRDEAASMLRVDKSTLWRWEKEGKLHSVKVGSRRILYRREDVENLLSGLDNM